MELWPLFNLKKDWMLEPGPTSTQFSSFAHLDPGRHLSWNCPWPTSTISARSPAVLIPTSHLVLSTHLLAPLSHLLPLPQSLLETQPSSHLGTGWRLLVVKYTDLLLAPPPELPQSRVCVHLA